MRVELKRQMSLLDSEIEVVNSSRRPQTHVERPASDQRSPIGLRTQSMMADLQVWEKMRKKVIEDIAESETAVNLSTGERSMRFSWLSRAVAPSGPVNSNEQFILIMGAFIGAVVGVVLCFVKEFTDTSFRNIEDASRYLDLPVLGAIPEVPGVPRRRRIRSQKRSSSVAHTT